MNGIRAAIKKDFFKSYQQMDADIFAIQETKLQAPQITDEMKDIEGYNAFWSHATVKKRIQWGLHLYPDQAQKN